jgi:hypothetical protein
MLVESMLSVYKQAEGIQPADEQAFGFYALVALGGIHHHHKTEEEVYCMLTLIHIIQKHTIDFLPSANARARIREYFISHIIDVSYDIINSLESADPD